MLKLATLCYLKRHGQTLLIHRIKKTHDMHAGKWNGLGGKFEPGETPEACVVREVYEESGLRIAQPELRGILTFPCFQPGVDWYTFVFVAYQFSGELIDSNEGVLAWVDDGRLLDLPLWEGDRIFLRWLDEERLFSARFVYADGRLVEHEVVFYPAATTKTVPSSRSGRPQYMPVYAVEDDTYCWVCGGAVQKRHCKIVCLVCGFTRDCGDP